MGLVLSSCSSPQPPTSGVYFGLLKQVREYDEIKHESATIRFEKARKIQEKYIAQGSNFEINIDAKMRDGILKVSPRCVTRLVILS